MRTEVQADPFRSRKLLLEDRFLSRIPAAWTLTTIVLGIGSQRAWGLSSWSWGICAALGLMIFWSAHWKQHPRLSFSVLLVTLISLSGGMASLRMDSLRSDDLSFLADQTPRPVHVVGVVMNEPRVVGQAAELPDELTEEGRTRAFRNQKDRGDRPRTLLLFRAIEVFSANHGTPVTGLVRMEIEGGRDDLHAGDLVEVWGRLLLPSTAGNPGDFDFREYLKLRGIRSIIRCKLPEEIRVVSPFRGFSPRRFLEQRQEQSMQLLERVVGPDQAPLAIALLLGPRHQLPDDVRRAFSESGAAHLLAISGLNVAILAGFVWFWGRLFNLRDRSIQWGMLLVVLLYLGMTDASPPLVRAAILLGFSGFGQILKRAAGSLNGLCLAATLILMANPADLFDLGAQLSFLAVLGLIALDRLRGIWQEFREPRLLEQLEDLLPWWERLARGLLRQTARIYLCTLAIWVFTQPLVLSRFQLLPTLGFLANVLLTPLVTGVLWIGYFILLVGNGPLPYSTQLLSFPGELLRWGLEGMEECVRIVSTIPGGHVYLPGPDAWWLWGYYLGLILVCFLPVRPASWRWSLRVWGAWWLIGFACMLVPERNSTTRCTVLSVGHGGAILLEFPEGQTILYDCGGMGNPERVAQTVQTALLGRGKNRIDLLVLSHADADHFNGTLDLIRAVPIRQVAFARSFLKVEFQGIRELIEGLAEAGIPVRLLRAGDRLRVGTSAELTTLHPPENWNSDSDNANSIVLEVEVSGKRLLLTGDLDRDGLTEFLRQPRLRCDVLLAPHHGGRTANPPELGAWAAPEFVIISGGQRRFMGRLEDVYPMASRIFWTPLHGGVTTTIDREGHLTCESFRSGDFPSAAPDGARRVR